MIGLFACGLILIFGTLYHHLQDADSKQRALEQEGVTASLNGLTASMRAVMTDYASWGEMIDKGVDPVWLQANIGPRLQQIYDYGSMLVDGSGSLVYAHLDGAEGDLVATVLGSDLRLLLDHATRQDATVAFLENAGRFFVVGAIRVGMDGDPGSLPGPPPALLFMQEIDDRFLSHLSRSLGIDSPHLVSWFDGNSGMAAAELPGIDGRIVGHLTWQPQRPGLDNIGWMTMPALGSALLALLFALLTLRWRRASAALAASEQRFRDFTSSASDWAWETDGDGRFTWVSDRFLVLTGRRPDEVIGQRPEIWRNADSIEGDWDQYRKSVRARQPFRDLHFTLPTAAGLHILIAGSGVPRFDAAGLFLGYRGTGRDVTANWEAQQRLLKSEHRFRSLVQNLHGIVFLREPLDAGSADPDIQIYGVDADRFATLVRRHGGAGMEAWYAAMHPDDRAPYRRLDAELREHGRPFLVDYRMLDPDGQHVRWVREANWLVDDGSGERFLDAYLIDITDRKEVEASLEAKSRENAIYRAIFEMLPDHVYAKDLELRFLIANPATAASMGIDDPARLIGRSDADLHSPDRAAQYRADELATLASGKPNLFEQPINYPDGSTGWVLTMKVPFRNRSGQVDGLVGHTRDITEQKRREILLTEAHARLKDQAAEMRELAAAAERASLAKTEFLAAMSHEIRTPMTGVLGMAELLAADRLTPEQRHHVETIRRSGAHLLSIINDILDFSRIEAGRLELEQVDFAPVDLLSQVYTLLESQATERGLTLRVEPDLPADTVVRGDPTRLRQVLVNLVGNALKFTAEGEVVARVQACGQPQPDQLLRFEVQDTGIGIHPDRQAELFEPFVQADRSTSRHYGGSGLGLAICRRLIDAMGGRIGVESQPGQGSLFWIEVALPPGDPAALAAGGTEAPVTVRSLAVLVVDDVAANRELLSIMLTRQGHRVALAENGADAVRRMEGERFDVVLMDVQMPVMDGMEATRRIRAMPAPAGTTPILALTANVMTTERDRYLAAGMDHCLTKPVIWPDLYAALAQIEAGGVAHLSDNAPPTPSEGGSPLDAAMSRPLLDRAQLDAMARKMPPGLIATMMGRGVEGAAQSLARLSAAATDPDTVAREAHRLRGTAGTFGLARVSALAGVIEQRAQTGAAVTDLLDLLDLLDATVAATRQAWADERPA